jgi:hypothetical protein
MNFHKFTITLAALTLATTTSMLAQSQAASHVVNTGPLEHLLGLGTHRQQPAAAAVKSVPDAVALGLATAKVYHFASADYPGASMSLALDENTTTVVGFSDLGGFTLRFGIYQVPRVPGSTGSLLTGINTTGEIVGIYFDLSGNQHGFLDNAGTFTTLDIGGGGTTTPFDINDSGEIVGFYVDTSGVNHGFYTLDSGTTYTVFDVPGATLTQAAGVNSSGTISGLWEDAKNKSHGFLFSGGIFTSVDFPTATGTTAIGINDSNEVAGYFTDAANVTHGFIYSAGNFTQVDVAGASATQLTRIKNKGQITGIYTDSNNEQHGLTGR